MRYASVCDGISAVSVAWHGLGWSCAWVSEIDKFCNALIEQRWGHTNLGDMLAITEADIEKHGRFDLLVGGTPCQPFSVAGLRGGLNDSRGNLALRFCQLAGIARPRWVVWENVPGVLSSGAGEDFGSIIRGLEELGYGVAWRSLDAQYFGLAQRRERVFAVGYLGDWRPAAAVLLEPESLRGDSAPGREAGAGVAGCITSGIGGGRGGVGDNDARAGHVVPDVSLCLNAGGMGRRDYETETFVARTVVGALNSVGGNAYPGQTVQDAMAGQLIAHSLTAKGFDASEDGTGRGTPIVPCAFDARQSDVCVYGPRAAPLDTDGFSQSVAFAQNQMGEVRTGEVFNTLNTNSNASGRNTPMLKLGAAVRRLTPRECERLQGFPNDYTLIQYRGKPAADGPRYAALGNSMAVPVMRWIGERIAFVDRITQEPRP